MKKFTCKCSYDKFEFESEGYDYSDLTRLIEGMIKASYGMKEDKAKQEAAILNQKFNSLRKRIEELEGDGNDCEFQ